MSGSISSEIPYEVEYSLRSALKDWINRDAVITTAIVNERDFHFYPLDPWQKIKILIPKYNFSDLQFDALLIQVALPRLYKHRPLYNVALYHELGHFIDTTIKLTEVSLLIGPLQGKSVNVQMHRMHRMEHFADLFAANYVGKANSYLLKEIAGRNSASFSHPSTADRIAVVEDFMSGKKNSIIDLFQQSLSFLKAPSLKIRYNKPDISNSFNNIRPYPINGETELHGLMAAAWEFLYNAYEDTQDPWVHIDEQEISRIVNDLTEKSIRNTAILGKWHGTT